MSFGCFCMLHAQEKTAPPKTNPAVELRAAAEIATSCEKKAILEKKSIKVTNKITNDMVTYKGDRAPWPIVPTVFKLTVNGNEIKQNDTQQIDVADNTIRINYEWEFKKMYVVHHREYRAVDFTIATTSQDFTIQFSWDDDFRLLVDNATAIQCVNLDTPRKKK
jgi:hypothetical protein